MAGISFWKPSEQPYGKFSNYFPYPIIVDSVTFASTEHFYQSQKYISTYPQYAEIIRCAETPHQAKMLANQQISDRFPWQVKVTNTIRKFSAEFKDKLVIDSQWEDKKQSVMMTALRAKFTQHKDLASLLKSTGNQTISENSPWDAYWGIGKDGTGSNHLGKMLMFVRNELQLKETETNVTSSNDKVCQQSESKVDCPNETRKRRLEGELTALPAAKKVVEIVEPNDL